MLINKNSYKLKYSMIKAKKSFANSIILLLILFIVLLESIVNAQPGVITTVAGTGHPGFNGDGGPAIYAGLNGPVSISLDSSGNILIADNGNGRIRKVDNKTGIITTIAGSGLFDFSSDGSRAIDTGLNSPTGVFMDTTGDIYIANASLGFFATNVSSNVSRVDGQTEVITTVAGTKSIGFSGDGGPATEAELNGISGLTWLSIFVDSLGNIYISDTGNHRIRKVDGTTGTIGTIVGNGTAEFAGDDDIAILASVNSPGGLFVDSFANIYIADTGNHRIRKVDSATGKIVTVAGSDQSDFGIPFGGFSGDNGAAIEAELNSPIGVFVDSSGNIFIADSGNNRVRKVDSASGIITTVAGNGFSGSEGDGGLALGAQLSFPTQVVLDSVGNMFIADTGNNRIRMVSAGEIVVPVPTPPPLNTPDKTGIINTVVGNGSKGFDGDLGLAINATLDNPHDLFLDKAGNIFIADTGLVFGSNSGNRIRRVDKQTGIITTVAGNGSDDSSGDFGPATEASFAFPEGLYIDDSKNIFIVDSWNSRIRKVNGATGIITTIAGSNNQGFTGDGGLAVAATLNQPSDLFLDSSGNLLIADSLNNNIRKVDIESGIITTLAGSGKIKAERGTFIVEQTFNNPASIFVDGSDNIFLADTNDHRIRKIDGKTGQMIAIVAGTGVSDFSGDFGQASHAALSSPEGVFVDIAGNVFISDTGNNRIRRVDAATGIITTVAGDGTASFDGDGGLAKEAMLRSPKGLFVDSAGSIFFADSGNNRIRKISFVANLDPGPSIASLVADDPDNGDSIYSDGDTITVVFSEPTNQPPASTKTDLDNLFTFSQFLGIDYLGTWKDASTLEILIVNSITATPPAVSELTVTVKESANLRNESGTSLASTATSPKLTGDFGTGESDVTPTPTPEPDASPTPASSPEPTDTPNPVLGADSANIKVSFDPDPISMKLFRGTIFTVIVEETNGVGLTITRFDLLIKDKNGKVVRSGINDIDKFVENFNACGDQPDGFIPGFDTACAAFRTKRRTVLTGETITITFFGIDENGNNVEASGSVKLEKGTSNRRSNYLEVNGRNLKDLMTTER